MECEIVDRLPSAAEYNRLRQQVGWEIYAPEVIIRALPQTLYCVCALTNGTTVGMARALGDGGLVYYVQDVIVLPFGKHHNQRGNHHESSEGIQYSGIDHVSRRRLPVALRSYRSYERDVVCRQV